MKTINNNKIIKDLENTLNKSVIGQEILIKKMLIALLSNGHLLVEGAPGLAKTKAIKDMSSHIDADFHRIQFTPDLLPGDLTGTDIFIPESSKFEFQRGPIFHNLLLADEINRAPAKVQSALLEAMAEGQVTVGKNTYDLSKLFLVMATQNPIDQEGTYPLPEAQLDRFLMHIKVDYPDIDAEHKIMKLVRNESKITQSHNSLNIDQKSIFDARKEVNNIHISPSLESYLVQLIVATRDPLSYSKELSQWIKYGSSPRGTISLDKCSRACAWLSGRDYVVPEDIHYVINDVLRHRIILSFEAEAEGITKEMFISRLINEVAVP